MSHVSIIPRLHSSPQNTVLFSLRTEGRETTASIVAISDTLEVQVNTDSAAHSPVFTRGHSHICKSQSGVFEPDTLIPPYETLPLYAVCDVLSCDHYYTVLTHTIQTNAGTGSVINQSLNAISCLYLLSRILIAISIY